MAIHPATLLKAAALIEEFEGIEEEAYLDPIGIPTICAGLTRYPNGTPVRMGDVCSGSICRAHLENMLLREYGENPGLGAPRRKQAGSLDVLRLEPRGQLLRERRL